MDINVSFKDPTKGWIENLYQQKSPKACTSVKRLMGKAYKKFLAGFGLYNTTCPIPTVSKTYQTQILLFM